VRLPGARAGVRLNAPVRGVTRRLSEGRRTVAALVVAAPLAAAILVASALAAQGDTILISRQSASAGGGSANNFSDHSAMSASGRIVAFDSYATTLGDADGPGRDVFARDTKTQESRLVSRRSGADGAPGGDSSEEPAISADGRFVAFESEADNLVGAANDAFDNIFVRDLARDRTILVSRRTAAAGGQGANDSSKTPSISADGRFVAFLSNAANLSGADAHDPVTGDLYPDVFVRDLKRKRTILVSRRSTAAGGQGGNDASFAPSISADGRYVAFASRAENLTGADATPTDVFVRDLKRNRTILVSRRSAGAGGEGADEFSSEPSISANGRFVAFRSAADNLSGADAMVTDIFVRDLKRERTVLASRRSAAAGGEGGNDDAFGSAISGDGRFVAFHSGADNLSDDDDDLFGNVFVRALQAKQTTAVSLVSNGDPADGDSFRPSISADGRFVAFGSDAANLSDADADDFVLGDLHTDIFRHDLLGP
jgi:Tol biopolymer transport system component